MANYIGNAPANGEFKHLDSIASQFNGSSTTFSLLFNGVIQSAGDASQLIVSLNGVIQEPLTSYTLGSGGSTITFSSAPANGDTCFIIMLGGVGGTTTPSDNSVTAAKIASGAVTTSKLADTLDFSSKTMVMADNQLSGDKIHGGTISAFTSTGIDDNASSNVITITSDGGVGIGTATVESAKLEISGGGIDIQDSGYPRVRFYVGSTFKGGVEAVQNAGSMISTSAVNDLAIRSQSNMLFAAGGNTESMRINSSGNVGIGTTSPLSGLHISDGVNAGSPQNPSRKATLMIDAGQTASADLQFMVRNGYNSHIFFGDAADPNVGMIWYQHNDNGMYFSTNTNQRMHITGGGTVSIVAENGTTNSGVSGASGGSLDLNGGTAFTGRLLFTGVNDSGTNLIGFNNESNGLVMYDYSEDQYVMKVNNDQKVSFGGGHPNVSGSSTRVYNIIVDDGICIGDGGYTHGYVGTNGTDGDVYIAANAYPANLGQDRNVIIATGSPGGGGPNEVVRYNQTDGTRRNYSGNTGNSRKWWSTTNTNFGEVYEYDYGNKLYFKKTRAVNGYTQMLLLNRYMPNQYDVSFELVSPLDTTTYRHFGIALNHVGSEAGNFDYLVLRQRFDNAASNQVRIDRPAGTVGTSQGSSIPNFHDGTKRKIMIQKRASTFRMQVHELNGSVYTYGTISGISWTNSSGYFGFGIYESTGTNTWAEISNLTITDVIA